MKQLMTFRVNGTEYTLAVEPNETLVNVLREELRFTGVKKGCDDGDCGACTVLMDGKAIPSCTTLACEAQDHEIVTIEGVKQGDLLHPVQQAFVDCFAMQCGFCTPGMILATIALLKENQDPTEEEIRDYLRGNICRCTGYNKIIDAVNQAKEMLKQKEAE
ncbi:MAG: (2Fe-2S)-binding protein [Faecousia sp.]